MSLLVASGLSLAYGPKVLFRDAGFSIGPRDRAGLVGANGTGKSSLLRMLSGEIEPDAGTVTFRRGARAGYLPQELAVLPGGPLVDAVLASVPGRGAVEARLAAVEAALHSATDAGEQLELAQSLADLHQELDHFEERHGRYRAERILGGLGFGEADLQRDTGTFSGGWRMRAALAGLLLQDPDLLLLDEPTNHLDVPTLTWFDDFLRATGKALVLISHDREFLDRQVARIIALEPEGLRCYTGGYGDYRRQRVEEEERLAAAARRQESRRAELREFIERFGAKATKARQAQSKRKMLERMEAVEVREERATLSFQFAEAPRSGREVLRLEGLSKAFGSRSVYRELSAQVLRGERVAIIGPNGAGKTTLLRLVAGELAPDAGVIRLGHQVVPGYYAQHHLEAGGAPGSGPEARTVLDALWEVVPEEGEAHVRGVAGSFLFSGDEVEKPLSVLSGGERARVALARVLLLRSNLLLLDEPTNHLDISSSEALIEALRGYAGTMLFVSHNRSFVNGLATRVWEVKGGGIADQPGNLDDWLYHQRQLAEGSSPPGAGGGEAGAGGARVVTTRDAERERKRAEAEARNARYAREKPVRDRIAALEARIDELERAQKDAEAALADPELYEDFARARPHVEALAAAKAELSALYQEWEERQLELEELGRGT